ncbi:ATP-dependent DNA helicase PIF1-like protein, partial [Leptotrombidium deliense]
MIPAAALESIDFALRDICRSGKPFGGKLMLLGGDFRQVLPVVKRAGIQQIINSTIKKSTIWNHFTCMNLSENMRADNDQHFADWLLRIGNGNVKNLFVSDEHYCKDVVKTMYENNAANYIHQAILTPRNDDVSFINDKIMQLLSGKEFELFSLDYATCRGTDSADENTELSYPQEYINTLCPSGFQPHKLSLKKGAIVMLIRD